MSNAVTFMVKLVIRFAPVGIFWSGILHAGNHRFRCTVGYAQLLVVLVGCMLLVALVINPLLVFWQIRRNPYPLVLTCLRESGFFFFSPPPAANIPVNMALAEKLNLDRDTYSVSIPLGATVNMAGAAITITVLTLAAVHTLGIPVDLPTALLLSVVASLCACGASGVAGGSLLLIPLALQHVRYSERDCHAGCRGRLHYRRIAGFLRNRAELLHRRAVYRSGLSGGRRAFSEERAAQLKTSPGGGYALPGLQGLGRSGKR